MNNKLFVFLVVLLSLLIIFALIALGLSIVKYNQLEPESNDEFIVTGEIIDEELVDVIPENERILEAVHDETLYILPSNTKEITLDDIKDMSREELNRAYNEIFARYGHDFKTKGLKEYFQSQSWYTPVPGKVVTPADLTDLENKNKDTILNRIREIEKK